MKTGDKVTLKKEFGYDKLLLVSEISDCGCLIKMTFPLNGNIVTRSNNKGEWFFISEVDEKTVIAQNEVDLTDEQKHAYFQAEMEKLEAWMQEDYLFYNS